MELSETNTLRKTDRDKNGFGSTNTHEILKYVSNNTNQNTSTPSTAAAAPLNDTNNDDIPPERMIMRLTMCYAHQIHLRIVKQLQYQYVENMRHNALSLHHVKYIKIE